MMGSQAEQYLWLSVQRYELDWLYRPGALILLALLVFVLISPWLRQWRSGRSEPN